MFESFFRKNLQRLGYIIFALVVFGLFMFLLAPKDLASPFESVRGFVMKKIESHLSRDRSVKMEVERLSPYWPPGITFHNIKLIRAGKVLFSAEKLSLRLRLLPLFTGTRSISYHAKAYGGDASGNAGRKKQRFQGVIRVDDFNLEQIDWLRENVSLPLKGTLSGETQYRISTQDIQSSSLKGNFLLKEGQIGPGTVQGFSLPMGIRLDNEGKPTTIQFELDQGKLRPKVHFKNDDGILDLKGDVILGKSFQASQLDLQVTFGFTEKVKAALPSILFDALLKPALGSNDTYTYRLSGWLARPRAMPFKL